MSNSDDLNMLPTDWWQREHACLSLRNTFQRHIAGLHIQFRQHDESKHELFTGFLLYHRGAHLWVTAAHVVETIEQMVMDNSVIITGASLVDNRLHSGENSIPVGLDDLPSYKADPDGFDFGAIRLRPGYAAPILRNPNRQFLDSRIWEQRELARPDGFYVLGFPYEWNDFKDLADGRGLLSTGVACLPAVAIEDRGETANTGLERFWGHSECLYAQLVPFSDTKSHCVKNIKGMSGGPIFSIERRGDQMVYRLFGIQSMWDEEQRIVRAVHINPIVALLNNAA